MGYRPFYYFDRHRQAPGGKRRLIAARQDTHASCFAVACPWTKHVSTLRQGKKPIIFRGFICSMNFLVF